jgi:Opioid growth factor receptor (OGFr) conserved region
MSDDTRLLGFYSGALSDDRGRFFGEILEWSDEELESVHDYVQWLFPLTEPSAFNPRAPLLCDAAIREFRRSAELRCNVLASFERMVRFYGFELAAAEEDCVVRRAANFSERARVWLAPMNHNHRRITRIIKCLRLVGLDDHAQAFFDALAAIHESERRRPRPAIAAETFRFWREAASGC